MAYFRIPGRETPRFVAKHQWECARQGRFGVDEFDSFWRSLNAREQASYVEDIDPALERLHEILSPAPTSVVLNFWKNLKRRERRYFVALVKQQKRQ